MGTKPVDNPAAAFLSPHDGVAISFWIISIAMIASTVFFFAEAKTVSSHWQTSLHVGGLVTLVAGVHYMYMREYWVQVHKSPIVYLGETFLLPAWPAFIGGMLGWFFILYEIFAGEAGGTAAGCSESVAASFKNMRMIVTAGWSIYPLGYLFGYLLGAVDEVFLNVLYNIADFVNKIAFVLACWSSAKAESEGKKDVLLA